jgi:predicted nucleic acid-binding protein
MPQIRAIVLDSNVFGKSALPNVKLIEQWAEACAQHDAELWMPVVVVYELSQHAVEVHEEFLHKYDAHQRAVTKWGVTADGPMSSIDIDEIYAAIESAGAVVVPLDGVDARDALLDQVLLRGAGQRKSGVKTGAADSAWVRSIVAHNHGDSDGLIVVTGDLHALKATCAKLGVDVPRYAANLGELRHLLDESEVATEPWASRFTSWLTERFVDSSHGRSNGEAGEDLEVLADLDYSNWWELPSLPDDGNERWVEQGRSVSTVQSAEVVGDIEHDLWSESLSARVELEVEVEEQYSRQDPSGHHVEYAVRRYPARVRGTVQAFIDGDKLDYDELLEEGEFLSVLPIDIDWQPM